MKHTSGEKTSWLIAGCDFAVATGGVALVKVVYEAGKLCHTVGAGKLMCLDVNDYRLKMAKEFSADHIINVNDYLNVRLIEEIKNITRG